jgi:acyl-CoA reductase-like NAD-dependent aldehyde dehydrogenase
MAIPFSVPSRLYVGGRWEVPTGGGLEDVINPADESLIGRAPMGTAADAAAAIGAARAAFDHGEWAGMPAKTRQALLTRLLDALEARKELIVALTVAEAGATLRQAQFVHYAMPLKLARATVALATRDPVTSYSPELTPQADGSTMLGMSLGVREPVGVVAAITAYNFPFFLNLAKIIPALAAGCTIVLKPSPFTPFAALLFGEAADEAGLPAGVLNIVNGGVDVGEALTTDPRVDLVTFTGSDRVGAMIQAQTAPTLKRVIMELGGKSAMIVRPDADLAAAAGAGLYNFTLHCGQGCALLTRQFVHNSVRGEYVARLKAMTEAMKVGDPQDPTTAMGPLIREAARQRTDSYVRSAQDEGATLVTGGRRPDGLEKGFFYAPTLLDNVQNDHRIAREEIFGPVGIVIGYDDDDEAIALTNDNDYGLGGGIFSRDVGKAYQMALRLRTGGVSINGGAGTMSSQAPFGGIKRSGHGKEYGLDGLNEFTYVKTIAFHGG